MVIVDNAHTPRRPSHAVVRWFTTCTPRALGFLRSRVLAQPLDMCPGRLLQFLKHRLRVSAETVRGWLHRAELVWRRPRPVLRRRDPRHGEILADLRALLRQLPADETVVFMDEVDINLNPDIGFLWMRQGQQAEVVTPGQNKKKYLAGYAPISVAAPRTSPPGCPRNSPHAENIPRHFAADPTCNAE